MDGAYLAFAVGPEVSHHADDVVKTGVGALVDEERDESADGVDNQASFDGSVEARAGKETDGPLPGQTDKTHDDVDDLEYGKGLDGAVEILGQEVPEDLGPEEGFDSCGYLVWIVTSQRKFLANCPKRKVQTHRQRRSRR